MRSAVVSERVDDRRLAVAVFFLDRRDEEIRPALVGAGERCFDRRDIALPGGRLAIAASSVGAVALGDHGQDRAACRSARLRRRSAQAREARIAARDAAVLVDGGNRHRRILEEPHEAHFGARAADRCRRRWRG